MALVSSLKRYSEKPKKLEPLAVRIDSCGRVAPASKSKYESSLHTGEAFSTPGLKGLSLVSEALKRDAELQSRKYGGAEPKGVAARFQISLPRSPQHDKLMSPRASPRCLPQEPRKPSTAPVGAMRDAFDQVRFDMTTLKQWFRQLDEDGSGAVSQREIVMQLRKRRDLLALMSASAGGIQARSPGRKEATYSIPGAKGSVREEVYRIKALLSELDEDGNGYLEWPEFVAFFRRSGMLLEYVTETSRNRTSLCATI